MQWKAGSQGRGVALLPELPLPQPGAFGPHPTSWYDGPQVPGLGVEKTKMNFGIRQSYPLGNSA